MPGDRNSAASLSCGVFFLEPTPSSHSSPDALAPTPGPSQDDCRSRSEQESTASTWAGQTEAKVFYNTEASPLSPRCAICRVPQWIRPHGLESCQCQGLGQCAFSWLAGLVDSGLPRAVPLTAHHLPQFQEEADSISQTLAKLDSSLDTQYSPAPGAPPGALTELLQQLEVRQRGRGRGGGMLPSPGHLPSTPGIGASPCVWASPFPGA